MRLWRWLLLVVLGAGFIAWRTDTGTTSSEASPVVASPGTTLALPDLDLVAGDGRAVRLSDWRGQHLLIVFGYTACPDVCPVTLTQLAALVERLGAPAELQVLMITVDPERDTPERLAEYVGNFHPSFVGLTGSPALIHEAMTAFHALAQRADPLVLHTDAVTLVDTEGRLVALYGQSTLDEGGRFDEATLAELERGLREALGRSVHRPAHPGSRGGA